jgi:hypothetical protein
MYETTVEAVDEPRISLQAIMDKAETTAPTPIASPVFDLSIDRSASNGFDDPMRLGLVTGVPVNVAFKKYPSMKLLKLNM